MRPKQLRLIVTFYTTTAAIMMEKQCAAAGVPGRLIPVPRLISASCGMAFSAPPESRAQVVAAAAAVGSAVDCIYELEI